LVEVIYHADVDKLLGGEEFDTDCIHHMTWN
jgi:hypothetical protein